MGVMLRDQAVDPLGLRLDPMRQSATTAGLGRRAAVRSSKGAPAHNARRVDAKALGGLTAKHHTRRYRCDHTGAKIERQRV